MSKKENMTGGYSLCMNEWALDKSIKNELGLLLIISSLTAENGYCYASNPHLAKLFDIDEVSISRKINKLINKGYLTAEYDKNGTQITKRYLRLTKMLMDRQQKNQRTVNKNVKENNTSINTTSNNNKKTKQKKFIKPDIKEIQEYCDERNNGIDAEGFYHYYESKDWKIGNTKMKNWKSAVITWEKHKSKFSGGKKEYAPKPRKTYTTKL